MAPADELFDRYGLRFDIAAHPIFDGKDVVIVADVAPESSAAASGLEAGAMILTLEGPTDGPILNAGQHDADSYAEVVLAYLADRPYIEGAVVDHAGYVATPQAEIMAWQREAQTPFLFPRDLVTDHLGLDVAGGGEITAVAEDGLAARAGLQVGDKVLGIGGGAIVGSTSSASFLHQLFRKVAYQDAIVDLRVERAGRTEQLQMEPRVVGAAMGATLDPGEAALFARLPEVLQPLFSSIYLGDFDTTHRYQMSTIRRLYGANAASIVLPALGLEDEARGLAEASRMQGIMAQYILIKSNFVGLCGEPYETFEVSETIIETTRDGYGFVMSEEIISHYEGEYAVPSRFLQVVLTAEPIRELAQLSGGVQDFVTAAGGCDSDVLRVLEDNMLDYIDYRPS